MRTFEVSPAAPIVANGHIAFVRNEIDQTHFENAFGRNLTISFTQLEEAVSQIDFSDELFKVPFKEPKAFIMIDVIDGIVTKIFEPYQE